VSDADGGSNLEFREGADCPIGCGGSGEPATCEVVQGMRLSRLKAGVCFAAGFVSAAGAVTRRPVSKPVGMRARRKTERMDEVPVRRESLRGKSLSE